MYEQLITIILVALVLGLDAFRFPWVWDLRE